LPKKVETMGRARDDLDAYIAKRTANDPELPARIDAALRRRELLRALAEERRARGLPRTAIAARMGTSEAAVARLETGEVDPRLSTIERFADALGKRLEWHLGESA
jgi:ribosome-binding protein aMBF1 (putative translation factor)